MKILVLLTDGIPFACGCRYQHRAHRHEIDLARSSAEFTVATDAGDDGAGRTAMMDM